jgi:predicted hydrocarbon binding protein
MGAAQAKIAIAENGMLASMTRLALKALPKRNQIKLTLETIAKEMRAQMNRQITLTEQEQSFIYQDDTCLYCRDWHDQPKPVCYSVVGFLHEMLSWATGDKSIQIEELVCRATGGETCQFKISFK